MGPRYLAVQPTPEGLATAIATAIVLDRDAGLSPTVDFRRLRFIPHDEDVIRDPTFTITARGGDSADLARLLGQGAAWVGVGQTPAGDLHAFLVLANGTLLDPAKELGHLVPQETYARAVFAPIDDRPATARHLYALPRPAGNTGVVPPAGNTGVVGPAQGGSKVPGQSPVSLPPPTAPAINVVQVAQPPGGGTPLIVAARQDGGQAMRVAGGMPPYFAGVDLPSPGGVALSGDVNPGCGGCPAGFT